MVYCTALREYGSSGEDVPVNAVINPRNWWAIPSEGRRPPQNTNTITYWCFWGVFSNKILALVLKTPKKHQYVMVLVFRGGL